MKNSRLKGPELKKAVERIVKHCEKLASNYVSQWQPVNPEWKTMDGCAYLRLSTDDQVAVDSGSLEQQLNLAIAEAVSRSTQKKVNYRIRRFFIEAGISGTKEDRPELKRMRKGIEGGYYKFVILKELSRAFRDAKLWLEFVRTCQENRCDICIRGLPIDLNDPASNLQLQILASFAEYESKVIGKRLKENIYSALLHNKKFHSTHPLLGLDPVKVNGKETGYYQANESEAKTVVWIMEKFLELGNVPETARVLDTRGILNKTGKPFDSESLKRLLRNLKYIGCWEVNEENKDLEQETLPIYDRYFFIEDMPHGAIVGRELFERVQKKLDQVEGSKAKNRNKSRVYLLHGLLRDEDGVEFESCPSTNRHGYRYYYYYNRNKKYRLDAAPLENEVRRIVSKLISDSKEVQDAMKRRCTEVETTSMRLKDEASRIRTEIETYRDDLRKLEKRLDALLDGAGSDDEKKIREQYRKEWLRLQGEIEAREQSYNLLCSHRKHVEESSFNWKSLAQKSGQILSDIEAKNPVAVKNAYREIFDRIVIGKLGATGEREVKVVLQNETPEFSAETSSVISAEKFWDVNNLG